MKHRNMLAAGALLIAVAGSAAARDLIEKERSAELALSAVTLPDSANDVLTLKECAQCPIALTA